LAITQRLDRTIAAAERMGVRAPVAAREIPMML
jgi:hypothetical protein